MKRHIASLLLAAALALPATSSASGIPVIDGANLAKAVEQFIQLKKAYETQLKELEAITGHSGIGELLNDAYYKEARRYMPETWDATMRAVQEGEFPGSTEEMIAIYKEMSEFFGIMGADEAFPADPEDPSARAFVRRRDTNYATFAVSETSFNKTQERIENLETLMAAIEDAEDVKAIGDLNARIAAENGVALAELLRLNAVLLQSVAAQENQQLVDETSFQKLLRWDSTPAE